MSDIRAQAEQFIERMRDEMLALPLDDDSRVDEWEIIDRPSTLKWLEAFGRGVRDAERQRLTLAVDAATAFLECIEWTDSTSETNATDVIEGLREAITEGAEP